MTISDRPPTRLARLGIALAGGLAMVAAGLAAAPAADAATVPRLAVGSTARFENFTVRVAGTVMDPEYYGYVIRLEVCVTKLPRGSRNGVTRISWDPWTVQTATRGYRPAVQEDPPEDTFPKPYESQAWFAVGQCATGWLPFWGVPSAGKVTSIQYRNSLGDRASWLPGKAPLQLGSTKAFGHFSVTIDRVRRDEFWYGVHVRVCARSLPNDAQGHRVDSVQVGWAAWSLRTNRGTVPMTVVQEGLSPWSPVYPERTRLHKGECRSGWLPFGVADDVSVSQIAYRNSLGEATSWQAP